MASRVALRYTENITLPMVTRNRVATVDIFISYAHKDHTFVDRLRHDLRSSGVNYWIDVEGLAVGTPSWEMSIRKAIQDCSSVIWVVSPASYDSLYVKDEITIARMKGRTILPVWVDGDHWMDCVPLGTGEIQFADMRGEAYQDGLKKLLEGLGGKRPELEIKAEVLVPLPTGVEPRNPYKGLHAFTEEDTDDFFGRSELVLTLSQSLQKQLQFNHPRFLAVLGPSGAGKSSVVMAGLIPRLKRGVIPNSQDWTYLPRIVPGDHPLEAFADALHSHMKDQSLSSIETDLRAGVRYLPRLLKKLRGEYVFLYVDQFEELFTLTQDEQERQQFIDLLTSASTNTDTKLITVLSMRADFYGHPMHYPHLGSLITSNQVSVLPMSISELYEAIHQPALLPDVGLVFDDGLVADIVFELRERNVALEGALPFLEFTLARLFEDREGNQLKRRSYEIMGGVAGAIGHHAETLFAKLSPESQVAFSKVFLPLTNIHPDTGEATRRRAKLDDVVRDDASQKMVENLVQGRLLTTGRSEEGEVYLEVAHEALFRSWQRLKTWTAITQQDLRDIQQIEREAKDWDKKGRTFIPSAERLQPLYAAINRLELHGQLHPVVQDFLYPQSMLLTELENPATPEQRRLRIGDDLALLGDPRRGVGVEDGLPNILWLPVVGSNGDHTFEFGEFSIPNFFIAKYQVTNAQYQTFVTAEDGYQNDLWWHDFPKEYQLQELKEQRTKFTNTPRDTLSWYQAVAFSRWLDSQYRKIHLLTRLLSTIALPSQELNNESNWQIRLPSEWEWQWVAQNGIEEREYPWGAWQQGYANTNESGLGRSVAVGMYPHVTAACGAMDMSGNVWEWCLNEYHNVRVVNDFGSNLPKVLRGGSFSYNQTYARSAARYNHAPYHIRNPYGFRLVLTPI